MPIGKRQQSNTMLYTVITFVGLFIVTTAAAVIFYIKAEDLSTKLNNLQTMLDEIASGQEVQKRGTIIGAKGKKTRLGTMVEYLDKAVYLIIGGLPEETSADVKIETINRKFKETLEMLAKDYNDFGDIDPNTTGFMQLTAKLKSKLDNTISIQIGLEKQLKELQTRFDESMKNHSEKEQTLLAEKDKYQQQVDDIQKSYDQLKAMVEQTAEQQVKTLMAQLDEERINYKAQTQELLKTQAEFQMAENRMKRALEQLKDIKPLPDNEVAAFQNDGKIIAVDDQAKIVHISIGSEDRVYAGLTFSVYDRSTPIPRDGKGKAEIEVFEVAKNFSAARILKSEKKNPILAEDTIANLIWDKDKSNAFVIAGEFDLTGKGEIDPKAADKLKGLIQKWGGKVGDKITIDTDYLVLGTPPKAMSKPSFEEIEQYPNSLEKYETSLQRTAQYQEAQTRAEALSIPVLNYERFLYFIGYDAQVTKAGAF